jgi:acylglycerol lipase
MAVIEIEDWIETYTIDTILYAKTWKPSDKIRATITFVHGTGEHIQRYQDLFTYFANHGIKVMAFDNRGHGRTAERTNSQGKSEGLEKTMEDILYISRETKEPGVKHFIMGHSLGGVVALEFARRYPHEIHGIIASAPALVPGADAKPNAIQIFLVWLFMLIFPSLVMPTHMNTSTLTRDAEQKQIYNEDPLIHGYMSVILASNILELGPLLMSKPDEFRKPLYIAHGSADRLTCPIGSREFFDKVPIEDKVYKAYDGFYHELHNEPIEDRKRVYKDYVDWILAHQ